MYAAYPVLSKTTFQAYLYVPPDLFAVHVRVYQQSRSVGGHTARYLPNFTLHALCKRGHVRPCAGEPVQKEMGDIGAY